MVRKKVIFGLYLIILLFIFAVLIIPMNTIAYADSINCAEQQSCNELNNEQNEKHSERLFTALSLSLNGGNGIIWATVKNERTLFPSTVKVVVMLYSSSTYEDNYQKMILNATNSTEDLDLGKTLVVEASTNGEQKYWLVRMRYKINKDEWKERITGPALYSSDGTYIGLS